MPDRNRLSTLNRHYCQQDPPDHTQDTMTTDSGREASIRAGRSRLLYHHHSGASMGRAKQATHSFFLCSSQDNSRLPVVMPKHRRLPAGIRQHTVCTGVTYRVALSLGSQAKMPLHSFSSVRGSASHWLPARGTTFFFYSRLPRRSSRQLLLMVLWSLVWLLSEVVRRNGRRRNFKMKFLPVGSQIYLSSKQDATSWRQTLLHWRTNIVLSKKTIRSIPFSFQRTIAAEARRVEKFI
jgi:hypothetical protein